MKILILVLVLVLGGGGGGGGGVGGGNDGGAPSQEAQPSFIIQGRCHRVGTVAARSTNIPLQFACGEIMHGGVFPSAWGNTF